VWSLLSVRSVGWSQPHTCTCAALSLSCEGLRTRNTSRRRSSQATGRRALSHSSQAQAHRHAGRSTGVDGADEAPGEGAALWVEASVVVLSVTLGALLPGRRVAAKKDEERDERSEFEEPEELAEPEARNEEEDEEEDDDDEENEEDDDEEENEEDDDGAVVLVGDNDNDDALVGWRVHSLVN